MSNADALRLERLAIGELTGVDLTLAPGEILCLSGASGSGKSRLLRAVADLEPHGGEAWLGELAQSALPAHEWRARVMLVPAESHWWADRVGDHLPQAEPVDLEALGFTPEVLDWSVSRLSSGEKQRLALSRAVARAPAALLLDEPTANLDDATTHRVEAWLVGRIRARGWPTLWVAHDRAQIARVADRHWRILDGRLDMAGSLLLAAARTAIQLTLVGLVLEALFAAAKLHWVALMALGMLLIAGREVMARQRRRLRGGWAFGIGTLAMFLSSFSVAVLTLTVIIGPEPWYRPQYAIPLLGMMLGNTMTGVALALDRLTDGAWQQRAAIENRLMLGQRWQEAIGDLRREAMRSGLMPTINAMAAAGVVSLPGMMTGQILAGSPPALAVKYQILVMFTITLGTGFGTLVAVALAGRRLFDGRQRLRLERLTSPGP